MALQKNPKKSLMKETGFCRKVQMKEIGIYAIVSERGNKIYAIRSSGFQRTGVCID